MRMAFELTTNIAFICCFVNTFLFVASLYVWRHEKRHDRDEPETIKKRLLSVVIACLLSTLMIRYFWIGSNLVKKKKKFDLFYFFSFYFCFQFKKGIFTRTWNLSLFQ